MEKISCLIDVIMRFWFLVLGREESAIRDLCG